MGTKQCWFLAVLMLTATTAGAIPRAAAPVPVFPQGSTYRYDVVTPNLAFTWELYQLFPTPTQSIPNNYIVCVLLPGDPPCSHATAVWSGLASAANGTTIRNNRFQVIGYQYSVVPTLPLDRLDQETTTWVVGGCTSMADSSCTLSAATAFIISTREMEAVSASGNPVSLNMMQIQYQVEGRALNRGSRETPPFEAKLEIFEALYDEATADCLKDPNSKLLTNIKLSQLIAFDKRGVQTRLSMLRLGPDNKLIPPVDIVGIALVGFGINRIEREPRAQLPAFAPTAMAPDPVAYSLVEHDVTLDRNSLPRAFISQVSLDDPWAVVEATNDNNRRAQCEDVQ